MELALYCPDYGFYEKEEDRIGRGGAFYTSVSVGPLFGELLAFQFAKWLAQAGSPDLHLVEAGAHDGKLAGDILGWLRAQRPKIFARTTYWILEPSGRRREWQRSKLAEFGSTVQWQDDVTVLVRDPSPFTIIFSNELLDAMPVQRLGWDGAKRRWFEWGVGVEGARFVWTRLNGEVPSPVAHFLDAAELESVLPDGYTLEISLAAEDWWTQVARTLKRGKLLTFDYGLVGRESVMPERVNGTLRAYRDHKLIEDVLAEPGEQDITAHVHFDRIELAGLAAGLKTDSLEPQGRFLTHIAADAWKPEANFGAWDSKRTRQFQTLTHPEHLGQKFRVLVQSRD